MKDSTINRILEFRDERDWKQFHTPRELAISVTLEAAELLEHFQWNPTDEQILQKKDKIAEELADVLIYSAYMAEALDLDIDKIICDKISKNASKYPVEKSYGKSKKYNEQEDTLL
ncbi:MAG: nucleotide pyrophosphohydrolase [Saccharofermentanales bacterium]